MFKRLNDSKLNVVYGTVGSGKTMAISLLLNELLIQKCNKNIIFETKVENKKLNIVCRKNRFTGSSLDRFILPLSNVLY